MNERQLLVNRTYELTEGRVNWYSSLEMLREYQSVERVDFFETTSSAGDWSGYIVQKIGNKRYMIFFNQENNWPRGGGFTVYTDKVVAMWSGELTRDEIESIVSDIVTPMIEM